MAPLKLWKASLFSKPNPEPMLPPESGASQAGWVGPEGVLEQTEESSRFLSSHERTELLDDTFQGLWVRDGCMQTRRGHAAGFRQRDVGCSGRRSAKSVDGGVGGGRSLGESTVWSARTLCCVGRAAPHRQGARTWLAYCMRAVVLELFTDGGPGCGPLRCAPFLQAKCSYCLAYRIHVNLRWI